MLFEAWDSGFVRATRRDVHAVLRDVGGYERWWPGLTVTRHGEEFAVTVRPARLGRTQRLRLRLLRERPDLGLRFACSGVLRGEVEWYYLDEPAGTVVHCLLRADGPDRGNGRILRAHRAGVRRGLHALKDGFEGDRLPGAEPSPVLLAAQQAAMAETAARGARRIAPEAR